MGLRCILRLVEPTSSAPPKMRRRRRSSLSMLTARRAASCRATNRSSSVRCASVTSAHCALVRACVQGGRHLSFAALQAAVSCRASKPLICGAADLQEEIQYNTELHVSAGAAAADCSHCSTGWPGAVQHLTDDKKGVFAQDNQKKKRSTAAPVPACRHTRRCAARPHLVQRVLYGDSTRALDRALCREVPDAARTHLVQRVADWDGDAQTVGGANTRTKEILPNPALHRSDDACTAELC